METKNIRRYLAMEGIHPDEIYEWDENGKITISIEWGDWKHEHLAADYFMSKLGYDVMYTETTEEDGSDCYSAEHTYKKSSDRFVTVIYGKQRVYYERDRRKVIGEYLKAVLTTEGSERERYAKIVAELENGEEYAVDVENEYSKY